MFPPICYPKFAVVCHQHDFRFFGRVFPFDPVRSKLVVRLAKENAGWGYRRIVGALHKLRLHVGRSSVRRILKEAGLTPSPYRRGRAQDTVWRKFIQLHLNTLVAGDFFTKNVITPLGVRIAYVLATPLRFNGRRRRPLSEYPGYGIAERLGVKGLFHEHIGRHGVRTDLATVIHAERRADRRH